MKARRGIWTALLAAGSIALAPRAARAQEEPSQAVDRAEIARAVDEYLSVSRPAPEPSEWDDVIANLVLYGDFRLRGEADFKAGDVKDRQRLRVRLRLGANYEVSDDFLFGVRIVSGDAEDANSTHATLGDGFDDIEISLDRAFVTWQPTQAPGFFLSGGKFAQGWYVDPIYGELAWDADVQPEGLLAGWRGAPSGVVQSWSLRAGQYIARESAGETDAYNTQLQGAVRFKLAPEWSLATAVGYYAYTNPDALFDRNHGNAVKITDGGGVPNAYASEFGIVNPIVSLESDIAGRPLSLALQGFHNLRAASDRDTGYAVGGAYGSTRDPGDWRVYLQWQKLEQDSVFTPFAQDDFLQRTNFEGFVFGGRYQLLAGVGFHLWALVSDPLEAPSAVDGSSWRLRLDLDMRF